MKKSRMKTANREKARMIDLFAIPMWAAMLTTLGEAKTKTVAKIDPGVATICAAILTGVCGFGLATIQNVNKVNAGPRPISQAEAILPLQQYKFEQIVTALAGRRQGIRNQKQTLLETPMPQAVREGRLEEIRRYEAANEHAESVARENHPQFLAAVKANDLLLANQLQTGINVSLSEEAFWYGSTEGHNLPRKVVRFPSMLVYFSRPRERHCAEMEGRLPPEIISIWCDRSPYDSELSLPKTAPTDKSPDHEPHQQPTNLRAEDGRPVMRPELSVFRVAESRESPPPR